MTKRVRLSPHNRRMQLLDCAGRIVLDNGLSKFTIDALAREAGVSTPLIYKYFDTRVEILQALLRRESQQLSEKIQEQLARSPDYEDVVRLFVTTNFDGARAGSLLKVLFSQPDVRSELDLAELRLVGNILVERTAQEFGLTKAQANQAVPMASAASRTAAERYSRLGGDRDVAINDTVKFIFGAFRGMSSIGVAAAKNKQR